MRIKFLARNRLGRVDAVLIAAAAAALSSSSAWGQALSLPSFNAGNVYNVTVANSSINGDVPAGTGSSAASNATAINAYISYVSSLSGGGTVEIPAGTFNSNLITLRSNVNLQLDGGAVLANAIPTNTLIQTTGSSNTNMEISGSGIINGGATTTVSNNKLVTLTHVTTLAITGVSIENASNEHLVTENDSNVTISNVTIADPGTLAANGNSYLSNTDGIDFAGSNFTIKNCNVNDGDDDICAKPQSNACSNILITNDNIGAGHGISVGGGTAFGISKMTVSNVTFNGTADGLRLKAQDSSATGSSPGGGTAHPVVNVFYSNIVMTNVSNPIVIDSFYGVNSGGQTGQNNFPSSPTQTNYAADSTTPMWENVGFSNVTINTTSNGGVIYDLNSTPSNLNGLSFNNVNINSGSAMNLWWGTNINLSGLTVNHTVNQQDLANVTPAGAANITWNNTGASVAGTSLGDGATWDTVANQNWNNQSTLSYTTYTDSSNVTFNDINNGHYTVTLNSTVSPISTTINNSAGAYTISGTGTIAGAGSLTKTGTAAATISTANAYTGGTIINGGTLILGTASALGASQTLGTGTGAKPGATTVNANGTLDLNGLPLTEPITLNGGTLTNSGAATASVNGGVKGLGYTTTSPGIGAGSTIAFSSGTASATPTFGITSASFSGFTGTYSASSGGSFPPQAPNVLITPSDGNGSGALGYAVLSGTSLVGVTIVNPGSGYDAAPIISFIGGNTTVPGSATGNANNFTLVGIQMTSPGSGYTSAPTATLNNVGGSGSVSLTPVIGSLTLPSTSSIGGNAGNIALALPITGAGGLIKTGSNTLTVSGNAGYLGTTQINQGTLAIDVTGSISQSTLNVNSSGTLSFIAQSGGTMPLVRTVAGININGGNVVVQPAPSPQNTNLSVLVTASLNITTGTLDLTSNDLIIKNTTPTAVQSLLKPGFNAGNGYWNGTSAIVSNAAANDTTHLTTLGYEAGGITFDTVTTAANDVLVKYTYYGDANLDGAVDGADYQQIDNGFGMNLTGWQNGDFNYDGVVDGSDFSLIDNTFNQISASNSSPLVIFGSPSNLLADLTTTTSVPEPTTFGLFSIAAIASLRRRRRNARHTDLI